MLETLFALRCVTSRAALANYDSTAASYRQTTLTTPQQVEDNLAALHPRTGSRTASAGQRLGAGVVADFHGTVTSAERILISGANRADRCCAQ